MDNNSIIELGKTLEQKKEIDKQVYDLKIEKGQLERDIKMYQVSRASEKSSYEKEKKENEDRILSLKNTIADLERKQGEVSSKNTIENSRLDAKKEEVVKMLANLESEKVKIEQGNKRISEENAKIEEKKGILQTIKEYANKLC